MICAAKPADVPAIAELVQEKRLQYAQYPSLFWRVAEDVIDTTNPF